MARPGRPPATAAAPPAGAPRRARRRPIGLATLRGYTAAARHLSFTLAAAELHLTQSAISRQVASLEREIGQPLFLRKTRALALTAAGERLLRAAHHAIALLDRTVDEIRGQATAPRVTLTTFASFASLWLVPRLAAFQKSHPEIELRIDAQDQRVDLASGRVDIAVRRCRPQDAPRGAVALLEEDVTPALSAELLNRHGGRLKAPADLLRLPLIEIDDEPPYDAESAWPHWFDRAGVAMDPSLTAPRMVVSYIDQSLQAAIRGQGVVLARNPYRDEMVAAGQLLLPFPALRVATGYGIYLCVAPGAHDRQAVGPLCDWVLAEFARPPARQR